MSNNDCVGCGYCCLKAPCATACLIHNITMPGARCPELEWSGERYMCKIADDPRIQFMIGVGCSSTLFNTWRQDIKFRG